MRRTRRKPEAPVLAALLLSLAACTTSGALPLGGPEIVERSRPEAPAWTALAPEAPVADPSGWRVVTVRRKLLDLPLGLKQTQLVALEDAHAALAGLALAALREAPGGEAAVAAVTPAELKSDARAAADVGGDGIKISDLYFEKTVDRDRPPGDPMAQHFAVFVLTAVPSTTLGPTLKALGQRLSARPDAGARHLGAVAQGLAARPSAGNITK